MTDEQRTIDFSGMPQMFGRCLRAECPQAENCLRQLAWRQEETRGDFLTLINPHTVKGGTDCPHFIDAFHPAYAKGLRYDLSRVPHADVLALRRELTEVFGKMVHSRMRRGLCLISPQQQKKLAAIFARHGVAEPQYEERTHPWELL